MTKTYCNSCGMWFKTKGEKGEHKKQFPDESCKGKFTEEQIMTSERDKPLDNSITAIYNLGYRCHIITTSGYNMDDCKKLED